MIIPPLNYGSVSLCVPKRMLLDFDWDKLASTGSSVPSISFRDDPRALRMDLQRPRLNRHEKSTFQRLTPDSGFL